MSNTTAAALSIDLSDEARTAGFPQAVADYRALDIKGKAAVRKAITDNMMQAVMASDIVGAQTWQALNEAIKKSPKAETAIDPIEILRIAVAELEFAASMIKCGVVTPAGLDTDEVNYGEIPWIDIDTIDHDSDAGRSIWEAAKAFAGSKRSGARSGAQMSIQDVVDAAFAGLEDGAFLSVAEIANRSGIEGVSTGAVAARLFPIDRKTKATRPTTLTGVVAGTEFRSGHDVKGARKAS